jgi:glycosyltransferase involved in cell wall biosynthesis
MVTNSKICFFISSLSKAGGTERVCTAIANKLSQLNLTVTVLTMYNGKPFFDLDNRIKLFSVYDGNVGSKLQAPLRLLLLRRRLSQIEPDVLINVDSALFIYSKVVSLGLKIKNVVWEQFNYNAAKYSVARVLSRHAAVRYSHAVITLTQADNKLWKNNKHCKVPVITINNPSPDLDYTLVNSSSTRNNVVLSVGRLTEQKGFDRLLEAWQMVKLKNSADWELHIVGSGELEEKLEQQIVTLGLTDSVRLIPATSALHAHYKEASIYCLSSRYEGLPMVLLEAQVFGLPIVSFDCETGPAEIIRHNETGLLVNDGDIPGLARAISSLIYNNSKRVAMGANAARHSVTFSIDTIVNNWQKLITTV